MIRGGPLEITGGGGGGKNFSVDEFFFSTNCLHEFFFQRESSARFFFDSTSFNVKEMQNFARFNYSTAEGDSLFGVSIFAKFEYRDYREGKGYRTGRYFLQVAGCRLKFNYNWKTAGTKNN